jgi:hypothetical protein
MKSKPTPSRRRNSEKALSHRKAQRPSANSEIRRYENAWDDTLGYEQPAVERSPWRRLRAFAGSRAGRVVLLAPVGAVGAYLFLRRRR